MRLITSLIAAAALVPALAQADAIKVGIANDISGPFSALGAEARDGFNLAIKQLGGKLGGQPAEFLQTDMGGNPDQARQLVTRYLQREKVDFFTGPIGSNVALAVGPALFAAKVPYLSNNRAPASSPAPSAIPTGSAPRTRTTPSTRPPARSRPTAASRRCSSWPRLSGGQGCAQRLQARLQGRPGRRGLHQAGPDRLRGRAGADPRGQAGRGLHLPARRHGHQFRQAVRVCRPVAEHQADRPGFSADEDVIQAVGEPMLGMVNTAQWAHDLDVPQNKAFVEAFRKEYNGRYPRSTRPRPTT